MSRTTRFCRTLEFDQNLENADVHSSEETVDQLCMQPISICQVIEDDKELVDDDILPPEVP